MLLLSMQPDCLSIVCNAPANIQNKCRVYDTVVHNANISTTDKHTNNNDLLLRWLHDHNTFYHLTLIRMLFVFCFFYTFYIAAMSKATDKDNVYCYSFNAKWRPSTKPAYASWGSGHLVPSNEYEEWRRKWLREEEARTQQHQKLCPVPNPLEDRNWTAARAAWIAAVIKRPR